MYNLWFIQYLANKLFVCSKNGVRVKIRDFQQPVYMCIFRAGSAVCYRNTNFGQKLKIFAKIIGKITFYHCGIEINIFDKNRHFGKNRKFSLKSTLDSRAFETRILTNYDFPITGELRKSMDFCCLI